MEFTTLDGDSGLSIYDPIENARFELSTASSITLESSPANDFYFPVDTAVAFDATAIEIPKRVPLFVRTQDGTMVTSVETTDVSSVSSDEYLLEPMSMPMKLYIAVDSALTFHPSESSLTVTFEDSCPVRVGARSFHDSPAGTITVTDDIDDAMAAVSLFGSALKTTSCERSFPTLRGHPPLVERGETFAVPDGIETPETGIDLVIPPEWESLMPVASLAYYLGANVVAGSDPRLVAGEFEHALDGPGGYAATVNRTLQQVFFLDCLTRTEGYYPVELYERTQVESSLALDFADLYNRPLDEQIAAYLSVPFETLESHMLDWHLTTDVLPSVETLPALPYLADDLSLLRTPQNSTTTSATPMPEAIEEFTRTRATAMGGFTRSTTDFTRDVGGWDWGEDDELFQLDPVETVEHAWVGNGYPVGANKVTLDSLRRRNDVSPPDESVLTVHVVCNDPEMAEENVVSEFYGLHDFITYNVSVHEETTTDELAVLFESSADFLHYIGHVNEDGFQCVDGYLHAESLDSVNVDAFILNACHSYKQGKLLVEKGSRGGVVTLSEVINTSATRVGRALARLLNAGFSLRSALAIAKDEVLVAVEYITLGDGGLTLCQSENGTPMLSQVRSEGDEYLLEPVAFPVSNHGIGTMINPEVESTSLHYLASGSLNVFSLSESELMDTVDSGLLPLKIGTELYWGDEPLTSFL